MDRITYISTVRGRQDEAMIADILMKSRANNRRDGLTGLLVVGGTRFIQVLEGEVPALDRAIARIKADPRHFAFVQIERKRVEQRSFPIWEMGHVGTATRGETLGAMVDRLTLLVNDPNLQAQLRGFAELHSKAA